MLFIQTKLFGTSRMLLRILFLKNLRELFYERFAPLSLTLLRVKKKVLVCK